MRRADRGLAGLTREQVLRTRALLQEALRRILRDVQVQYLQALAQRPTDLYPGASFRLARSLALVDQLDATIRSLNEPSIYTDGLMARATAARVQAQALVVDVMREFGDAIELTTPMNHRAVSGVVRNAATRLHNYSTTAVQQIEQSVVDGLARGRSWQQVARDIRGTAGVLAERVDMIAHTELHSAQADARRQLFASMGVDLVIRYVTDDDRTCGQCAPRQGEVLPADQAVEVLHPRCRCVLAPFRPEWVLDGGLPLDELQALRAETRATMEAAGTKPLTGPAPFERVFRGDGGVRRGDRVQPLWTPDDGRDALERLAAAA